MLIVPPIGWGVGGGGSFPEIVDFVETSSASSNYAATLNLPPSVNSGDLLILAVSNASSALGTSLSGWTIMSNVSPSGSSSVRIFYKVSAGSEPSTVTLSKGFGSVVRAACYRIVGGAAPTFSDQLQSSSTPSSPSHTSGVGGNVLWLSVLAGGAAPRTVSSPPSGFDYDGGGNQGSAHVFGSHILSAGSALTPGSWSLSGSLSCCAATIAIPPA